MFSLGARAPNRGCSESHKPSRARDVKRKEEHGQMSVSSRPNVQIAKAALLALALTSPLAQAQEFEVATIKPTAPDWNAGRYMRMKSANQFEAKNYTLKVLASVAYNLSAPQILGGPDWVDSDRYDI